MALLGDTDALTAAIRKYTVDFLDTINALVPPTGPPVADADGNIALWVPEPWLQACYVVDDVAVDADGNVVDADDEDAVVKVLSPFCPNAVIPVPDADAVAAAADAAAVAAAAVAADAAAFDAAVAAAVAAGEDPPVLPAPPTPFIEAKCKKYERWTAPRCRIIENVENTGDAPITGNGDWVEAGYCHIQHEYVCQKIPKD